MTTRQEIGRRVREARRAANLSQQAVADASGIPRTALSNIETGTRNITALELVSLVKVLGCSAGQLLGLDDADRNNAYRSAFRDGWRACARAVTAATDFSIGLNQEPS